MPRVAAVTMTYNEPDFMPIWTRHYARHVGAEHCYVFDHGSDDGSTDGLGDVNVIRLPRSPFDEPSRRRFINAFCGGLLEYYDFVSMAASIRVNLAQGEKLARRLPSNYSRQTGWVADPCQCRQPPQGGGRRPAFTGVCHPVTINDQDWWLLD